MNKKKDINPGKILITLLIILIGIVISVWLFFNIGDLLGVEFGKREGKEVSYEEGEKVSGEDEIKNGSSEEENLQEEDLEKQEEKQKEQQVEEAQQDKVSGGGEEKDNKSTIGVFIYFSDEQGERLVGELREVSKDNYLKDSLGELLKGPTNPNLLSIIPSSTKILDVNLEESIAKVNFSKEFVQNKLSSDVLDRLVIFSIVNTLTEFEGVNAVEFYIDGEKLDVYGQLDISGPVYRNPLLIK